jgi:hypothetical protein
MKVILTGKYISMGTGASHWLLNLLTFCIERSSSLSRCSVVNFRYGTLRAVIKERIHGERN